MAQFETIAVHGNPEHLRHRPSIDLNTLGDEISAIENSSKQRLEERIASLERAKHALCFSSGLAAVTSISMLLEDGDHAVIFDSVYHGTRTNLNIQEALEKVEVSFVDLRDASVLEKYMKHNTKMVWIETPCNPTMKIVDIAAISEIVKRQGKAFLVVDNTFMSAYFQNPLLFGADIVMHSLTKYMNGHSDVLMGAAATNNEELYEKLKSASQRLKSHPQHELALKQCRGFSGMVSFRLKGGTAETRAFASRIKIFTLAVSLGTVESLVDIPSLMTASALDKECREMLEITDSLIRLSIGLESAKDLIEDLDQALLGDNHPEPAE